MLKKTLLFILSLSLIILTLFGCSLVNTGASQYLVEFYSDDGSAVSSITVNNGDLIPPPTAPTKTGFTFDGWYKDSGLTAKWDFSKDIVAENIILYAKWIKNNAYNIRDIGPAGGIIFYINPNANADGWKYLECAPQSTEWSLKPWGGFGTLISGADGTAIGSGKQNTIDIVTQYGASEPYENSAEYAAKLCTDLIVGNFDDWFLPSKDELNLIYTELYKNTIGGFSMGSYWTSSEFNSDRAMLHWFLDGEQHEYEKYSTARVRAIRAFK